MSLPDETFGRWTTGADVRPFILTHPAQPAWPPVPAHAWFPHAPLTIDASRADDIEFVEMMLRLDAASYAAAGMAMPRWVFYDCGVLPGLVAGFAARRSRAGPALISRLDAPASAEWVPISLFIMIPGREAGAWVAHNLCSANALLGETDRFAGLGVLTKAFGLWFAGARTLYGVTQWTSRALPLHALFGDFEILSAYTPIHSHPETLTYRLEVDPDRWIRYFRPKDARPKPPPRLAGDLTIEPKSAESLKSFQRRLEEKDARYYLNADQITDRTPHDALIVYKREPNEGY